MTEKPWVERRRSQHGLTDHQRFWEKVDTSGDCWEWLATKDGHGYGSFWLREFGRTIKAHRACFFLTGNRIPAGACVLHDCDNPGCVRPSHLRLGTQIDNLADMRAKGRSASRGERNGQSRLTAEKVRHMRRVATKSSETHRQLAARFGVSQSHFTDIINRRKWTHV